MKNLNSSKHVFTVIFTLLFVSSLYAEKETHPYDHFLELGVAATLGNANRQNWQGNYGGTATLEFNLAKYFTLGTGVRVEAVTLTPAYGDDAAAVNKRRAVSTLALITPKLVFPIYFSSAKLVPFLKFDGGFGAYFRTNSDHVGFHTGMALGIKYFFAPNWGVFADYGFLADYGFNARSIAIESSLSGNIGFIFSFIDIK